MNQQSTLVLGSMQTISDSVLWGHEQGGEIVEALHDLPSTVNTCASKIEGERGRPSRGGCMDTAFDCKGAEKKPVKRFFLLGPCSFFAACNDQSYTRFDHSGGL